jgi:CubicO group peptidase (beta-lactamase class C family)
MTPMRTVMPQISADVDLFPGVTMKHSIGFALNMADIPGKRPAGSMGWAGVLNTHFWVDPASDVAGVILMQHLPFVDPKALSLYDAFERAVYAA